MPIIEPAPPDAPLNQGDILSGITLFATASCWESSSGTAAKVASGHCLVLSRPCVVRNKQHITVCAIDRIRGGIPRTVTSFDDMQAFLQSLRDGTDQPDVFYLGELPGNTERYAARFDSIHSVQIPDDPVIRDSFVKKCRIARLNGDFVHDLHARLFRAFASLGFDDVAWLSDADLELTINLGNEAVATAKADLHSKQAEKGKLDFGTTNAKRIAAITQEVEEAGKKLADLESRLALYSGERSKRRPVAPS